jgi:hypothetical protein
MRGITAPRQIRPGRGMPRIVTYINGFGEPGRRAG